MEPKFVTRRSSLVERSRTSGLFEQRETSNEPRHDHPSNFTAFGRSPSPTAMTAAVVRVREVDVAYA